MYNNLHACLISRAFMIALFAPCFYDLATYITMLFLQKITFSSKLDSDFIQIKHFQILFPLGQFLVYSDRRQAMDRTPVLDYCEYV